MPLFKIVQNGGVNLDMYVDFLMQAYHHVKHTYPLLALASSRTNDKDYQAALLSYMNDERGHEEWVLDDIEKLTGSRRLVPPQIPCQVMVGYAYYAIEHVSPYTLMGSVYVLEGISVILASTAAASIKSSLNINNNDGFSYLISHGALDIEHVKFFEKTINQIAGEENKEHIVASAKVFYKLYGDIFRDIYNRHVEKFA
jgi:pyrroloquinoline quinone (PQQ) biosynthesis protein C